MIFLISSHYVGLVIAENILILLILGLVIILILQLRPSEYFTIARGLNDPSDTGTYFVRAVIRNARTDALIETINLTDQGNRRFSKAWQVPADTSGQGFYILITTTVYTDSGYSSVATNYTESFDTYLVEDRPSKFMGGSGGGVDYKKLDKMLADAIAKIPPTEIPKAPNQQPIFSAITALEGSLSNEISGMGTKIERRVDKIVIPVPEKVDLKPVLEAIKGLNSSLSANLQALPKPDFNPVLSKLDALLAREDKIELSNLTDIISNIKNIAETFNQELDAKIKEMTDSFKTAKKDLSQMVFVVKPEVPTQNGKAPADPNLERVKRLLMP